MNDEQLNKLHMLKEEKLSVTERDTIRGRMLAFVEAHPARIASRATGKQMLRVGGRSLVAGGAFALFVLSGGVSFAAERSLPGDLLYPIKVRVNEGVERVLAVTPEAKSAVAHRHIETRAIETEQLVEEARLSDSAKATLRKEAQSSLRSFDDAKAQLEKKGKKIEAKARAHALKETIAEHREALAGIGIRESDNDNDEDEDRRKESKGERFTDDNPGTSSGRVNSARSDDRTRASASSTFASSTNEVDDRGRDDSSSDDDERAEDGRGDDSEKGRELRDGESDDDSRDRL
jgi:hypothetical protein